MRRFPRRPPKAMETPKRQRDLLWGVRRSVRYHNRRRAWFERWHHGTLILAIVALSGVALNSVSHLIAPVGIVFLATNVVCRFADRASDHKMFAANFRRLEHQLLPPCTEKDLDRLHVERLEIETEEPPVKRLLDVQCHYELWKATRQDYKHVPIVWWRRWTVNWFSHGAYASTLPQPVRTPN